MDRIELQNPKETARCLRNIQHSLNMLQAFALENNSKGNSTGLNPDLNDLVELNNLCETLEDLPIFKAAKSIAIMTEN